MNKLKLFGVATLAAASISVGGLVAPESASALPNRAACDGLAQQARIARAAGNVFWGLGQRQLASYYYGRASVYRDQALDCYDELD